jgi:AcrR family transcriptional regulator
MDKRSEKTLESIFLAFSKLINTKDYDDITIQDILDESKIGRSTFYTHFKTKNDLLLNISQHIFDHVFSHSLQEEKSHDFSKDYFFDYKHLLTHILYHIRDEKDLIKGVLLSKGNGLFLEGFKSNLIKFTNSYYNNYPYDEVNNIPLELKKEILIENFITIIKYWIKNNFSESPELITEYFISLIYTKKLNQ